MDQPQGQQGIPALVIAYFVLWAVLGGGGLWYVLSRPTTALKGLWWTRFTIGFGAFMYVFMVAIMATSESLSTTLVFAAVLLPFLAMMIWLNIRNTYFCDGCGKRTTSRNPFVKLEYCPRCGAKFSGDS